MNALGIVSLYGTSASGSAAYTVSGVSTTGGRVLTSFGYTTDFQFDPLTNNFNEVIGGHEVQHIQTCTVEFIPTGISASNTTASAISEMALPTFVTSVTLSGFRESYSGEINHANWLFMGKGGRVERREGKTVVSLPLIAFDPAYTTGASMATRTSFTS